jgi:hypothetical protein
MSERRFALADFTHMSRAGCLRLYGAGHTYALPRAIAHAATKHELVTPAASELDGAEHVLPARDLNRR